MRVSRSPRSSHPASIRRTRGISVVELMVGIAVGLVVVAAALMLLADFTSENRRLLLETRLMQDMRAAQDVITRDLRRAGYWRSAMKGVWWDGGPTVPPQNPYRSFVDSSCPDGAAPVPSPSAGSHVCYAVDGDGNDTVDANEYYGFHLSGGVIYAVFGGSTPQPLTDPDSITVTDFVVTPSSQEIPMGHFCKKTCTSNCPRLVIREFEVLTKGNIPTDPTIQRSLRSNVRVRNDYYDGQCPA